MTSCNAFRKIPSLVGGRMHYLYWPVWSRTDQHGSVSWRCMNAIVTVTWPARVLTGWCGPEWREEEIRVLIGFPARPHLIQNSIKTTKPPSLMTLLSGFNEFFEIMNLIRIWHPSLSRLNHQLPTKQSFVIRTIMLVLFLSVSVISNCSVQRIEYTAQ